MKTFTSEQIEAANNFFDNYLNGNVDIESISPSEIKENIALPSLFIVAFTTSGDASKIKINKDTKIGDFDVDLSVGVFCYPKNGSEDSYSDPTTLLQVFIPKWFESMAEEGVLIFNMKDKKTRDLTLQEIIDTFNDLGLEIDQKILYNMHDNFLPLFEVDKSKKLKNK